ncbi:hypothetical protein FHS74_001997 [Nitrospirillum iridis]|uniref:Uncharacterized protein n=2 Tax=Nitrospirillum iridis TaxID=765888 RepID=A0A7X0EDX6_9PROT|nr:hypothetical protein [Nitrospirillum iridis]
MRAIDMADSYRAGRYVNVWTLVGGWPRCHGGPMDVTTVDQPVIARQLAINAAVRALAAAADAYEAAAHLTARPCPPVTLGAGPDGAAVPNPAFQAWTDALALVSGAGRDLLCLVATRGADYPRGDDGQPIAAYVMDLPPPPTLTPGAETADWDGTAWTVRPVTADEAVAWRALMAVRYPRRMSASDLVVRLLTGAEWLAIVADAHPSEGGASLAALLLGAGTQYVDLDAERTAAQLRAWVDRGLITPDRMAWILTGQPPAE